MINYVSDINTIVQLMRYPTANNIKLVKKACRFSEMAHRKQFRHSGEPYFVHVFETAKTLTELGLDAETIAAGFLHDVLEDTAITEKELEKEFGREVLFLVQGVTKLTEICHDKEQEKYANMRNLFRAVGRDVRVLIIKLADRLHNIRTLHAHSKPEKRFRIARETLDVFAPLANRLGMGRMKGFLEDYSFPYAYPSEHQLAQALFRDVCTSMWKCVRHTEMVVRRMCERENVVLIDVNFHVKHLYSFYQKYIHEDRVLDRVRDVVVMRIIVPHVTDCYHLLGLIHTILRPSVGDIKDYIAVPKPNGYRSLHTTVFGMDGCLTEIQIRTQEMHEEAERGITCYLSQNNSIHHDPDLLERRLFWIGQLVEWQDDLSHSQDFLESIKSDFANNRVFVFTPNGDLIDLPKEATVVDFAYAVSIDLGNHLFSARVNGKKVDASTVLKYGDVVKILSHIKSVPQKIWLSYVKTTLAERHIKSYLHL